MAESEFVEWSSKKGKWESYSHNENGNRISLGFQTGGVKPSNEQVLYKYADYLSKAVEGARKPTSKGGKAEINSQHYNIKNFINEELGNHYSSFQIKAILKSYNDGVGDSAKIFVLKVGPMGRKAQTESRNARVATFLADKHKGLAGKTFET